MRSVIARALALGAGALAVLNAPAGFAEDRKRIAILPVVVHSADSRGYLREGLADMVTSRLEQIDTLEVVRVDDPAKATTRASEARERGREAEADYVLFGSFTRFGEGASLDMQCIAVAEEDEAEGLGPNRQIFVQSGNIGDVIPDLDNLVGKISRFAGGEALESDASAGREADPESLADLRRRVEALEAALRTQGVELSPGPGVETAAPEAGPVGPEEQSAP